MAALAGQVRSEQHETTKKGTLYCLKMNIVRLLVDNFSLVCLYLPTTLFRYSVESQKSNEYGLLHYEN